MSTLSPIRNFPLSSGMLNDTSKSLRLIDVVASAPSRTAPYASLSTPKNSACRSTGRVTPLIVRFPEMTCPSSLSRTEVVVKVSSVPFSGWKKSEEPRCASRCSLLVVMEC